MVDLLEKRIGISSFIILVCFIQWKRPFKEIRDVDENADRRGHGRRLAGGRGRGVQAVRLLHQPLQLQPATLLRDAADAVERLLLDQAAGVLRGAERLLPADGQERRQDK
jgi:hypothetical protein